MSTEPQPRKRLTIARSFLLQGIAIFGAMVAQNIFSEWSGDNEYIAYGMPVILLVLFLFLFSKELNKAIGKLQFAIANVALIAIGTIIGTFVLQLVDDPRVYIDYYGETWTHIFGYLCFTDLFHAWWYVALFILLVLSLIEVTRRRPWGFRHFGFHLVHVSLIVIAIGVWTDFYFGFRGIIPLTVGEKSDIVTMFFRNTTIETEKKRLNFNIQLGRFETEMYDHEYRIQIWHKPPGQMPTAKAVVPVEEPGVHEIAGTDLSFTIDEFYPDFSFRYEGDTANVLPEDPVLIADALIGDRAQEVQLRSLVPDSKTIKEPRSGAHVTFGWYLSQQKRAQFESAEQQVQAKHRLFMTQGDSLVGSNEFAVGDSWTIPGTDNTLTFVQAYKDLRVNTEGNEVYEASNVYRNPAIQFEWFDGDTTKSLFVFSRFIGSDENPMQAAFEQAVGMTPVYQFTTGEEYIVVGGERMIYKFLNSGFEKEPFELGDTLAIGGPDGARLVLRDMFPNATRVRSIPVSKSDEYKNPRALVTMYKGGDTLASKLMFEPRGSMDGLLRVQNEEYFLALGSVTQHETKSWTSLLTVVDSTGAELHSEPVEVNRPMHYGGMLFYQLDFDPDRPDYSGIGVSYEPGLYVIYTGFYGLVIGVFLMFYVTDKKKKQKRKN